jgi:hypothetical protein
MKKYLNKDYWKSAFKPGNNSWGWVLAELLLLGLWALWVGQEYLDFDPNIVPFGREFGMIVQSFHFWDRVIECGWCALWDGSQNGGFPAIANPQSGILHPIIMLSVLALGVVNGSKIIIIAAIWFAGVANWALAKQMKLGFLPRIWGGAIVMVGGHLAGRMEPALITMVLATAMVSLVYPAVLAVANSNNRKTVVILAVISVSAILAGQGYLQLGLLVTLPAFGFLLLDNSLKIIPRWKDYAIAAVFAALISAPFLVPFINLSGKFSKDVDFEFFSAQPLTYSPLNLVIDSFDFYIIDTLSHIAISNLYILFIGWVPVILAIIGLSMSRMKDRQVLYLASSAALIFLFVSPTSLKWFVKIFPTLAFFRFPSYILGAAITPIIGVSAYGLDRMLKLSWPKLNISLAEKPKQFIKGFSLKWILLIPLVIGLNQAFAFSRYYLASIPVSEEALVLLEELKTEGLEWIQPPFGEQFWLEPAVDMGMKISIGLMPWSIDEHPLPIPLLEATRYSEPPAPNAQPILTVNDVYIYFREGERYASVLTPSAYIPCVASGSGGRIEVRCSSPGSGILRVKENMLPGWEAWIDGDEVQLVGDNWLEVEAMPGEHLYTFRYLPWDVPVGLALSVLGISLCVWWWRKPDSIGDISVNSANS